MHPLGSATEHVFYTSVGRTPAFTAIFNEVLSVRKEQVLLYLPYDNFMVVTEHFAAKITCILRLPVITGNICRWL